MKIGLVIYGSLDIVTGGFLYDRLLVEYLESRGDRVEVVSLPWPTYGQGLLDNYAAGFRERLEGLDCDVLLQDALIHPSFFRLNRRLRRVLPCPLIAVVLHLRGKEAHPPWLQKLYRWVEKEYLNTVDGFICISRAVKGEVEEMAGSHRPLVVARPGGNRLPGGISREEITSRALAPGPLQIVFVANLIPRKELHTLMGVLADLPRDKWRLTVAGSLTMAPAYVAGIRGRIEQEGLEEQVSLLGTLAAPELAELMTRSHLQVMPSSYEAFGIVYLEGMNFGLPAIAATAGGAREIIHHGVDGYLVAPGDRNALARRLADLMGDRRLLLRLSLAAKKKYTLYPTWEESFSAVRRFLHIFVETWKSDLRELEL